jgi:hypothetical protein
MTTAHLGEAGREQPPSAPVESTDDVSPSEWAARERVSRNTAAAFTAVVILSLLAYLPALSSSARCTSTSV